MLRFFRRWARPKTPPVFPPKRPTPFPNSELLEERLRATKELTGRPLEVFADLRDGHKVKVNVKGKQLLFTIDRHGNTKFKSGEGDAAEIEAVRLQVQACAQYLFG